MKYIKNKSNNPYYNLAFEEYILTEFNENEDCFLLWQNAPTIVVGKHQNTIEEINLDYVKSKNINVVRRLSGGGAVYHDLGNLNFTFIVKNQVNYQFDFRKFTKPVIKALKKIGIEATFNSRNDLVIDGKKFSGNAQYMKKNRLLHHGTLMFNSDIDELVKSLSVSDDKIISKGIKSVRSRVANISDYLNDKIHVLEFKEILLKYLQEEMEVFHEYELNVDEESKVREIMNKRYKTWQWNYGESPKFNIKKVKKFDSGKIETLLDVENGYIGSCKFYGDFFSSENVEEIEEKLVGIKYEESSILNVLKELDINKYFLGINVQKLIQVLI
ncbi:lipoate--protein ligase [Clostridium sediminicola]|uniref:lipoate--protein ligase n=1 Tax=Clostridium sediminicola TaxID=3114879 RepID=UPI0031F26C34